MLYANALIKSSKKNAWIQNQFIGILREILMLKLFTYLLLIFSLLIAACKTSGHRYVDINSPPFGAEYIPKQINNLLENNGFHKIEFSRNVTDPNATPEDNWDIKKGKVIDAGNKLIMRYQHKNQTNLIINVTIDKYKGNSSLEFFEENKKELSEKSHKIFQQVIKELKNSIYDENDIHVS